MRMRDRRIPSRLLVPALAIASFLLASSALAQESGSNTGQFQSAAQSGLFAAIFTSFGAGVVASLTPCVFPMVPMTVAFFGAKEAQSRAKAFSLSGAFVLGIACLFTPMGVGFALAGKSMGSFLGNTYVVLFLAAIFFALAASMFGAFEMALPSGLNNKLATKGGAGYGGAFVAGLVMGLIAAPCTGPFLTGLLTWIADAAGRNGGSPTTSILFGGTSMFAFSLGLGLPFFLAGGFALNMPKGGAWMMGIKWASGVAFSYLALSYLRDAPQFGLQKLVSTTSRYGTIALALVVSGLMLGSIHISAEQRKSAIAHWSKRAKLASIIPAVAGTFMLLSWLAKVDPILSAQAAEPTLAAKGSDCAAAAQINWETSEPTVLGAAKTEKKPVLVDFGASWCAACKELEEQTWPNAAVRKEASRYVALKVDGSNDEDAEYKRLAAKYKVVGLPVVLLLDADGNEKARFTEFVKPDKMTAALTLVH